MIADVITTEVLTKLERVVAMRPREVVNELILRNVSALRECIGRTVWAGEVVLPLVLIENLSIVEQLRQPAAK